MLAEIEGWVNVVARWRNRDVNDEAGMAGQGGPAGSSSLDWRRERNESWRGSIVRCMMP